MNNYCVYMHRAPNGKVYIGITCQQPKKRWKSGHGYQVGTYIRRAIDKYGWDSFEHVILKDGLSKEDACFWEREYIDAYDATDESKGYNLKQGGDVGAEYTETARKKISKALKRFHAEHPEERDKIANRMTGRKHSEEARKRMSDSKTGSHPKRTVAHNDNIRKALIDKYAVDEELRKLQADRLIGYGMSKSRPIEQMTMDGRVIARFESGKAAKRATGISDRNINGCCRGARKSAGGYRWRFAI